MFILNGLTAIDNWGVGVSASELDVSASLWRRHSDSGFTVLVKQLVG